MADQDSPLDPRQQPQPQDQQQQGAGSGLLGKWNEFIDHPENRAGLMQFSINMLAGRPFAESVGGAAEASTRNIEAQRAEQAAEEAQTIKERETAAKESTAESYGRQVSMTGQAEDKAFRRMDYRDRLKANADAQVRFRTWMNSEENPADPLWRHVKDKFGLKNKAELLTNKAAQDYMQSTYFPVREAYVPPEDAETRYDASGRPVYFDRKTRKPLPDQY